VSGECQECGDEDRCETHLLCPAQELKSLAGPGYRVMRMRWISPPFNR
jgi:hypothetical protein